MPDEPRHGDVGRHGTSSSVPGQDPYDRPTRRRRRSMEDSGGVSVSDLVAKHSGSRSDLRPVAPPVVEQPQQPSGSHRAVQQQPPQQPQAQPGSGGHRRAAPDEPPSQPRLAPQPPRAASPPYRMQPQGTGRTRSDNDIAAGQRATEPQRTTEPRPEQIHQVPTHQVPAQADPRQSQRMPRPGAGQPTSRTSAPRGAAPRRAANQPGGPLAGQQRTPGTPQQSPNQQQQNQQPQSTQQHQANQQPRPQNPRTGQPPAGQGGPGSGLNNPGGLNNQGTAGRLPAGATWNGQTDAQQGRGGTAGPLPAASAIGGAGVALPARGPRTGRPNGNLRAPRARSTTMPTTTRQAPPATPTPAGPGGPGPGPANGQQISGQQVAAQQIANQQLSHQQGGNQSGGPLAGEPVGPGSRAGMMPVGRQAATALAVPVRKPQQAPQPQPAQQQPVPQVAQQAPVAPQQPQASAITEPTPVQQPDPSEQTEVTTGHPGVERREDIDPTCLTTEMEAISEVVQQKRRVDATLARFSAVHDEMAEEERQRRTRRVKLMPWLGKDDDMEEALSPGGADTPPEPPVEVTEQDSAPGKGFQAKFRQKRAMRSWKIASVGAAALVLVACFFGWRAATNDTSTPIQEVAALDENSPAILESQKQYGDSNFLLVGTTDRPGATATGDQSTNTMMVAHIPQDGSRAVIVSFPPNLQVNRPACQQWNNQTSQVGAEVAAKNDVKLNSIYATGGPRCLTDTVQQITGLRINHFVGIDLAGFRALANSVGGVQMCVKAPLQDAALGTIIGKAGNVTLSGDQALNFVRADQIMGGTGVADFTRIERQQKFFAALLRKTVGQQNLLMNVSMLNNFLATFTTSTFGDNMDVSELTKLATSLQSLSLGRVTFVTLPTTGTLNQSGDETIDPDDSKQLFGGIIDNSPLPDETSGSDGTSAPDSTPITASSIKIQVINGIGDSAPGAAGDTATALRQQGFQISQVGGPAPANVQRTVIKYSAAQLPQAELLASSVPSATLQADPSMDGAIQLIIGPGFDHKVQAPQTAGSGSAGAMTSGSEAPAQLSYVNAADTSCA